MKRNIFRVKGHGGPFLILFLVVAGLVLSDFGFAEVAETTPIRNALPS